MSSGFGGKVSGIAIHRSISVVRALFAMVAVGFAALSASPASAAACTVTPSLAADLGSYSPSAVRAGAVPPLRSRTGLACSPGLLKLLSGNYIRATFQSRNALKLAPVTGTAAAIPYLLSADPNAAVVIAQNGTVDYLQNDLLNVLGLLGGTAADLPFFVRPSTTSALPEGVYTDRVTVKWDCYLCQGIGALGACLLGLEKDSATTVVDVTLTVAAKRLIVTTRSVTTWDPVSGTNFPKPIPSAKRRTTISLSNPDIVATDGSVDIVMPVPARQTLAFDGDGTPTGAPLAFAMTSADPSVAFRYDNPASVTDDVDFSADRGMTWNHVPTADGTETNAVRLRPRGRLPAGATIDVSFAVSIR